MNSNLKLKTGMDLNVIVDCVKYTFKISDLYNNKVPLVLKEWSHEF